MTAPIGSVINNIYSCRVSIMLGSVLMTTGLASSAFVPNLDWMILTCGVLLGKVSFMQTLLKIKNVSA